MTKYIIVLICIATAIRILPIFNNSISFHYDMARDAYEARSIWDSGDFKIIGPPTSTPGLFHGPLYYYLLSPLYGLGDGNPRTVSLFLSFLNSLTIIPLFILAEKIFKNKNTAFLAGLLLAFSFEATQYGPWLSNPSPAMLTMGLFFLGLWIWHKGKSAGLYAATLAAALSAQFQFFLIYLFAVIVIFKFLFKVKVSRKEVLVSALIGLLGLSTFIIALIKFKSLESILGGFLGISVNSQIDFRVKFTDLLINYVNRFSDLFINNFFPVNVFLGGILGFLILYIVRKEKFILFLLLSNFLIFIFGGHTSNYVNIGLVIPAILGVIVLIKKIHGLSKTLATCFIVLILIANIYTIFKNFSVGQIALVIPKDMILRNQLKLIDKTYQVAGGKAFSINTLTLPLWTNTTWAYLYSWYGKSKYGYVPYFSGHDQIGLLGNEDLKRVEEPLDISFFIMEPHIGIPANFYEDELNSENAKTNLGEQINFGEIKLQIRNLKLDKK